MNTHFEERRQIWHNQLFDLHKHLITINAGTIILLTSILNSLFTDPVQIDLVESTLILLVLSLGSCFLNLMVISFAQYGGGYIMGSLGKKREISIIYIVVGCMFGFSITSFFTAIYRLTEFFLANYGT